MRKLKLNFWRYWWDTLYMYYRQSDSEVSKNVALFAITNLCKWLCNYFFCTGTQDFQMISSLMIRWSENTLVSWTSTSFIWRFFWEKHVLENVKFNCLENSRPKTRNSNDAHYECPKMLDLMFRKIALHGGLSFQPMQNS